MCGTLPQVHHLTEVMIHSTALASTIKMSSFFCYSDFTFLPFFGGGGREGVEEDGDTIYFICVYTNLYLT